jgi:dipeptidyl aminopeptidase/acylaminoacyl peptidase
VKRGRRNRKVLFIIGAVLGVCIVGASPVVASYVASMPPFGMDTCEGSVEALGMTAEEVSFPADDGLMLRGWFFPAEERNAPAVLYVHGSGGSPKEGLSLVSPLHDAGYSVLLFSYRNHGPSDKNWFEGISFGARESRDVDAAIRYLHDAYGIEHIALQGFSMGAASVLLSAPRNPSVEAVVAESPYASFNEVWTANGRPVPEIFATISRWLVTRIRGFNPNDIEPVKVISRIAPRPLLLIHGTADPAIPWQQSQELYDAAKEPKSLWLVEGAGHGDARKLQPETYLSVLLAFYKKAFGR